MSQRLAVTPAPGPLESFAQAFDDLLSKRNQREVFRRYLEGLLLPSERNKTLTGLANTEPLVGSTHPEAQKLQWFLSESTWDPAEMNDRRLTLLQENTATAATASGVLVIDETGDRKWGSKTAHVGRQYLGSIGKIDSGVVSVHSLWADERLYYPLEFEPYTPRHWFVKGDKDPQFRSKPAMALALVRSAIAKDIPFRAVVADSFYGENDGLRDSLHREAMPYVLALYPSHTWWHKVGTVGSVEAIARSAPWREEEPGKWQKLTRHFRDGHEETWWLLEGEAGPYGVEKPQRLIIATTDPASLPELSTWYLVTNLSAPGSKHAEEGELEAADLAEVVRLYGLRVWVEQSYKQVKQHLGWAEYQVRKDIAMRRHWQLVCCAFSFCWWALSHEGQEPDLDRSRQPVMNETTAAKDDMQLEGKKKSSSGAKLELARGIEKSPSLARALPHAHALLASLVEQAPTAATAAAS
jgi:hypothetical protein